jgi:hypothetical protein
MLQGSRCYFDASLLPDNINTNPRQVGIGIFIINLQATPTQYIHIQARLQMCTCVLMAESAALALAALMVSRLNIMECSFLSDCEQLVRFINSLDHSNPPDWRIKPFTQIFSNLYRASSSKLLKISRNFNSTADALARQALNSQSIGLQSGCSHQHGLDHCFISQALHSVDLHNVLILAARCCQWIEIYDCCKKNGVQRDLYILHKFQIISCFDFSGTSISIIYLGT